MESKWILGESIEKQLERMKIRQQLVVILILGLASVKMYFLYKAHLQNGYSIESAYNGADAGHYLTIANNIANFNVYSDTNSSVATEGATWRPPFWPFILTPSCGLYPCLLFYRWLLIRRQWRSCISVVYWRFGRVLLLAEGGQSGQGIVRLRWVLQQPSRPALAPLCEQATPWWRDHLLLRLA